MTTRKHEQHSAYAECGLAGRSETRTGGVPLAGEYAPVSADTQRLAYALTQAVAEAAEPKPTLDDVSEWIYRVGDQQYSTVQTETVMRGRVPDGMARELAIGRKAIDLLAKIIERKEEVLFLLRAPPRHERGRK